MVVRALFDEGLDYPIERLRLFAVAEVAGLVDDVHFRFGINERNRAAGSEMKLPLGLARVAV